MAGRMKIVGYERDDETIGPLRIGPGTITAWNAEATGNKEGYLVRARGGSRTYGCIARTVTLSRPIGDGTPYSGGTVSITVPVLTKVAFAALNDGDVKTYAGKTDWVVSGQKAESNK